MTNVFPPSFVVPARMFQGTIGVEAELDEESTSSPRKSILDKVSERMEESTATRESDALDVLRSDLGDKEGTSTRVEKRSGLDMLFG